jgi:DNA-binding NarL/FixJ family response regulator
MEDSERKFRELADARGPDGDENRDRARDDRSAALQPWRVLIVEDEVFISLEAELIVTSLGHEVVGIARTADAAIELAGRERPHFVLMDIRLDGERDGIDAAVEIRKTLGIPSLFATAHNDPQTIARAAPARPAGFLVKPYTAASLAEAISKVFTHEAEGA